MVALLRSLLLRSVGHFFSSLRQLRCVEVSTGIPVCTAHT